MDTFNFVFEVLPTGEIVPYQPPKDTKVWEGEDLDAYISRIGFTLCGSDCEDNPYEQLKWYERTEGKGQHQYLVEWYNGEASKQVFVPDWPTLLKLRVFIAPVLQLRLLEALAKLQQKGTASD